MAETTPNTTGQAAVVSSEPTGNRRNEKVGIVVSTKMQKTIVVEIEMRKAHPKYKRVMKSNKKFYAHDEQNSARLGDVVRIREVHGRSRSSSGGRWKRLCAVRRCRSELQRSSAKSADKPVATPIAAK